MDLHAISFISKKYEKTYSSSNLSPDVPWSKTWYMLVVVISLLLGIFSMGK